MIFFSVIDRKNQEKFFVSRNLSIFTQFFLELLFGNTPYWNLRVHKAPCEKDFFGQDWQAVNSRCLLLCLPKYEKWGQIGQTCVLKKKKKTWEKDRKKVAKAKTHKSSSSGLEKIKIFFILPGPILVGWLKILHLSESKLEKNITKLKEVCGV